MKAEIENNGNHNTSDTPQNEKPSTQQCWWHNPTERFTFFVAIFTLCLVVVGVLQRCTLEKTDLTSRLRDRAFVNFSDPMIENFPSYNPPRKTINIIAHNTGNVPARNVSINYDCVIDKEKTIDDPFVVAKFTRAAIPLFIGPKQGVKLRVCNETHRFFDRIANGEINVFIVVRAEYLDGFDSQHLRTTQTSRQLRIDKTGLHSFSFAGPHNCIDEDCNKANPQ